MHTHARLQLPGPMPTSDRFCRFWDVKVVLGGSTPRLSPSFGCLCAVPQYKHPAIQQDSPWRASDGTDDSMGFEATPAQTSPKPCRGVEAHLFARPVLQHVHVGSPCVSLAAE